jgi:hypothetical protein
MELPGTPKGPSGQKFSACHPLASAGAKYFMNIITPFTCFASIFQMLLLKRSWKSPTFQVLRFPPVTTRIKFFPPPPKIAEEDFPVCPMPGNRFLQAARGRGFDFRHIRESRSSKH